ncbi:MAG: iron-containing redox enzyme family protein [Ignavibacteria bacterium]|nr:iron-containing redox enzyme family protein [Ignavibacteria bacterium]
MEKLSEKIDKIVLQKSLLKHPFYQKWNEGILTFEALRGYSKEYFTFVKSVPQLLLKIKSYSSESSNNGIEQNISDEIEHISLWKDFAFSLGVKETELESYPGLPKTQLALKKLDELITSLETGSALMYAVEKEIPTISLSKIDGLIKFYDFKPDKSIQYFIRHLDDDVRHCETWKTILNKINEERHHSLKLVANEALDSMNLLLDACLEEYC